MGCLDEPIKSMAEKVIFAKGKRIRPSLVYLFGSTSTDSNTDKLLKASAILELVHIATLVHDDILDDASHRRVQLRSTMIWGDTQLFSWEMPFSALP